MWSIDVMSVGAVNDKGVPLDMTMNMRRLSRVCGLATGQRVSLILQGFDDLTENEKHELFKNSIQANIEISGRAEAEREEGSYEDHLSCLEELQE
jgi:hypothetical protein